METSLTELLKHKGSEVYSIAPKATVEAAAKLMRERHIGAVLVMTDEKLVGILTERDILNKVVAEGGRPKNVSVQDIMTAEVIVIEPKRTVRDAMQVVTEKKLRHLPVVEDDHIVGMLSGGDLTRSIVAEEEELIHSQEGYIDNLYAYIYGTYPG